jgi:hypothetical protein
MSRAFTILFILGCALMMDKLMTIDWVDPLYNMKFVLIGIAVGGIYIFRFGHQYSEEGINAKSLSDFSLLTLIPGKRILIHLGRFALSPFKDTKISRYFETLYCPPVASERALGGFFFGKTMITTAIAFYSIESISLLLILVFSAIFDSLTGTYQHTLMNWFHRTLFENKILQFVQNMLKRLVLDIFRAEIIMLLLQGMALFDGDLQFHIIKNRLVSATYYFNAVIIDRLVEMGTIGRNFRSNFVIVASTIGGMLLMLDFAQTSFPAWVPAEMIESIPTWMPGPLKLLMYFNIVIFVCLGSAYILTTTSFSMKRVGLAVSRMLSLLGKF